MKTNNEKTGQKERKCTVRREVLRCQSEEHNYGGQRNKTGRGNQKAKKVGEKLANMNPTRDEGRG